ncbi:MAG: hypothetical protein LBI53_07420 [Candidatus Peribacteria bacterium]|jgi:hypothetical protein|nr:hypothetical protein [Candidatus Peribacteria bacterium]
MNRKCFLAELTKLTVSIGKELDKNCVKELQEFLERIKQKEFHLKCFCTQSAELFNYIEDLVLQTEEEKKVFQEIRDCVCGADERARYFGSEEDSDDMLIIEITYISLEDHKERSDKKEKKKKEKTEKKE